MSNLTKVAIVTGSNRGIGNSIVKGLCQKFNGIVYLTARNEADGKKAVEELESEGFKVNFHQLDIDNIDSIKKFASYIKEKYQGLDILVNNAAIAYKAADTTPFGIQAEHSIRVNYTGTLNVCNEFFPLLRPHARVVNVSSRAGMLKVVKDANMRAKLLSENLTIQDINEILNTFIE
jgi:carbonyl reductase 1